MMSHNIPKERWNGINRESLELKRLSGIINFSLSAETAAALLISMPMAFLILIAKIIFPSGISFDSLSNHGSLLYQAVEMCTYIVCMFVPFILSAFLLRQNPFKAIRLKPIREPRSLLPAAVISLGFYYVGVVASELLSSLLKILHLKTVEPDFKLPSSPAAIVIYVTLICLIAPVFEEFIFRGMILQNLRRYGNAFAIVVSSLLFALIHGNLIQAPFAFVAGLALGYFAIRLDSIFGSIILHAVINTVSVVLEALSLRFGESRVNLFSTTAFLIILGLTLVCIAYRYKKRDIALEQPPVPAENLPSFSAIRSRDFFLTPGFFVFAAISVTMIVFYLRIV